MSGPAKLLIALIAALSVVALGLSGYLSWSTWNSSPLAGCTGEGLIDCDTVLSSVWSKWLGMPVSLFGLFTYVVILASLGPVAKYANGLAWTVLFTCSLLAAGAAMWFIGLQALVIHSFCFYCMIVHTCGISVCVCTLLLLRSVTEEVEDEPMSAFFGGPETVAVPVDESPRLLGFRPLVASVIAAVCLGILMAGQLLVKPETMVLEVIAVPSVEEETSDEFDVELAEPDTSQEDEPEELSFTPISEPSEGENGEELFEEEFEEEDDSPEQQTRSSRMISIGGLPQAIDLSESIVLGNPDAEHVLVEMLDYTCRHCRRLHPYLHASLERYGDQLAIVVLYVPLSKKCNSSVKRDQVVHLHACDYARLGYSVWKLAPEHFAEFHDYLLEKEKAPSIFDAREQAMRLAGEAVLIDEELKNEAFVRVRKNCAAHVKLKTGLPLLLTEKGMIRGVPQSEAELFEFLETKLGLQPLPSSAQ